ncbi:MAG: hypothetical protein IKR69_05930 [Bacteroidales bacterium]|nr:hypothetical protein [Bacteroidales bacterium]
MKKLIILAVAVAAMAGCAKVQDSTPVKKEVTFEVANRLTKATTGGVYSTSVPFGTYAWFTATSGSDHAAFMVNEQVAFLGGVWKNADNTFYWPKTGSVDFISYSPFAGTSNTAGTVPVITQNSITYTDYTAGNTDIMYADKATCSSNIDEINDTATPESGFTGVPTLFRHALAKVSFKVKANFVEWPDPLDASKKTTWEVTIRSAKISGLHTTGSCALTLNADGKSWDKPVTNIGGTDWNIWTNLSGSSAAQELVDPTTYPAGVVLTTDAQDLNPLTGYVIPQSLEAGVQMLDLDIHIKTTLPTGNIIEEDYITSSATPLPAGKFPSINLSDISNRTVWQINENITYTINIKPTAKDTEDDTPEDVIITFDPAVADWVSVSNNIKIQL